jgi:type II secretory pathway component GspD/PulD (secretin)
MRVLSVGFLGAFMLLLLLAAPRLPLSAQEPGIEPIAREIEALTGARPVAAAAAATSEVPAAPAPEPNLEIPALPPPGPAPEEPAPPPSTDMIEIETPATAPEAATRTGMAGQQLISISLDNVPLEDVVRMFTRISRANIIASSSNLQGSVTVNLTDVEWQTALSSILEMHGLALREKLPGSAVYSIVPRPKDEPEPMIVETLFLEYTTVPSMGPVLKSMLVKDASISEFPSRNAIVVRSTSANLGEIKQVAKLIDIPGQQVCIETEFLELSDSASKQLGIRWDSLEEFGTTLSLGPFSQEKNTVREQGTEDISTRILNKTSSDSASQLYDANGDQIAGTAKANASTLGEVSDTTVTGTDGSDKTLSSALSDTADSLTASSSDAASYVQTESITAGDNSSTKTVDKFTKKITEKQSAVLELDAFKVVLSALKKTEGVSVISNPKLIVANGEDGKFSVGDREPIIRSEFIPATTDTGKDRIIANLDTSIETDFIKKGYFEKGIVLTVTPVVKSGGLIEASINPTLRRSNGNKEVGGNTWPIVSVKEIKTRFTLRDRQTVAIGGLTDTTDSKAVSKVPLLGDIPLIGKYLFSHTKDVKSQVETIIFVTLSLTEPATLKDDEGIPRQAELVHRKLLQQQTRRREFDRDMRRLRELSDAAAGAGDAAPTPTPTPTPTPAPEPEPVPVAPEPAL